jgi:hypothetical protein
MKLYSSRFGAFCFWSCKNDVKYVEIKETFDIGCNWLITNGPFPKYGPAKSHELNKTFV